MTTRWTAPTGGATVQAVVTMLAVAATAKYEMRAAAIETQRAAEAAMNALVGKIDITCFARHTALELLTGPTDVIDVKRAEVAIQRVLDANRILSIR